MNDVMRAAKALASLEEVEATVVVMRYVGGLSEEETSRLLGMSVDVSQHIGRVGMKKALAVFKNLGEENSR